MSPEVVLKFWFEELSEKDHFSGDKKVDDLIRSRFLKTFLQASQGEFWQWRRVGLGRLAEILVLDQFSRNLWRGKPECFAQDSMALTLAQEAVALGVDREMTTEQKGFLFMPYMHSESKVIHEEALKLFSEKGLEGHLDYEIKHKAIIDRFGRYPHRNKILGRQSTDEEIEFLKGPNSSF
jgi:uncharacterized protein (DUF924 family)